MTADRGARLWLAAAALAAATLLAVLLILAVLPDTSTTVHGEGFQEAVNEAQADRDASADAARSYLALAAFGMAAGAPLGLAIAGVVVYRRSRSELTEGR